VRCAKVSVTISDFSLFSFHRNAQFDSTLTLGKGRYFVATLLSPSSWICILRLEVALPCVRRRFRIHTKIGHAPAWSTALSVQGGCSRLQAMHTLVFWEARGVWSLPMQGDGNSGVGSWSRLRAVNILNSQFFFRRLPLPCGSAALAVQGGCSRLRAVHIRTSRTIRGKFAKAPVLEWCTCWASKLFLLKIGATCADSRVCMPNSCEWRLILPACIAHLSPQLICGKFAQAPMWEQCTFPALMLSPARGSKKSRAPLWAWFWAWWQLRLLWPAPAAQFEIAGSRRLP